MAYGNLKKRYLSALQEGPEPYSYEERDAASLAEEQITGGLSPVIFFSEQEASPHLCLVLHAAKPGHVLPQGLSAPSMHPTRSRSYGVWGGRMATANK